MLDNRSYYNKRIGLTDEDYNFIIELKKNKFGKKSLAGVLKEIIEFYKLNNK